MNVGQTENEIQLNSILDRYEILTPLDKKNKVFLVKDKDSREILVQKHSTVVDQDLYMKLKDHPVNGVPVIYEIIRCDDGELLLIEDYIHGHNLEHMVLKSGVLTESEVVEYMLQLCHILESFHEMSPKIIHRDIKPSNIIVTNDLKVYLVDFNTSRTYKQGGNLDTTAFVTQHFSAPELYGFGQSDQRSDIYSIGATMHYLLTGGFLQESSYHGILETIIRKCTMMSPKDRYQFVDDLAHDLEKIATEILNPVEKEESSPRKTRDDMIKGITLNGSYMIPGFRTKTWWKMLFAVAGYLLIADVCFTLDVQSTVKPPLDLLDIWLERIDCFVFLIVSVFIIFNYKNCQSILPFSRRTSSKLIVVLVGLLLAFFVFIGFLVIEANILGIF